jgi:uncharacterized membrane protein
MEMKTIQSSISVIAGIACIVMGVIVIFGEQAVPFRYVLGIILCFVGVYAIAHGMSGLGFKVQPQVGMKLPI